RLGLLVVTRLTLSVRPDSLAFLRKVERSRERRISPTTPTAVPLNFTNADNRFEPHWGRPLNQSLKGLLCPHVCIAITHEATARMVVQVDSHQLPHELVDIEIFTEVPSSNRLDNEL